MNELVWETLHKFVCTDKEGNRAERRRVVFLFFFLLFSLYWSLKHVYIFIGKVHTEVQADSLVGRGSGKTGLLTY